MLKQKNNTIHNQRFKNKAAGALQLRETYNSHQYDIIFDLIKPQQNKQQLIFDYELQLH